MPFLAKNSDVIKALHDSVLLCDKNDLPSLNIPVERGEFLSTIDLELPNST